jgi:6-phosphogluconolactonase (cycloisomerase 2 family)
MTRARLFPPPLWSGAMTTTTAAAACFPSPRPQPVTKTVHVFRIGTDGGAEGPLSSTEAGTNPSWICGGARDGRREPNPHVYACLESVSNATEGGVAALTFDASRGGSLRIVNTAAWPTNGGHDGPAHCAVPPHREGGRGAARHVVAASYGAGNTAVFGANPQTGSVGAAEQTLQVRPFL